MSIGSAIERQPKRAWVMTFQSLFGVAVLASCETQRSSTNSTNNPNETTNEVVCGAPYMQDLVGQDAIYASNVLYSAPDEIALNAHFIGSNERVPEEFPVDSTLIYVDLGEVLEPKDLLGATVIGVSCKF